MADADSRSGTRYDNAALIAWLDALHAPHDTGLAFAFEAPARADMPQIQVGVADGKLLELLLAIAGAKKVVEVGTLAGYSTIRLARGVGAGGRVWTCEYEPKHAEVARQSLAQAGVSERVEVLVGAAAETLPTLVPHGPFDAVFIDADKGRYDVYGRWAAANLRPGGLLLGDNAYFFGRLLDPVSADAAAMRRFHEEARAHFDTVCVPTPDGLLLGRRR